MPDLCPRCNEAVKEDLVTCPQCNVEGCTDRCIAGANTLCADCAVEGPQPDADASGSSRR